MSAEHTALNAYGALCIHHTVASDLPIDISATRHGF